MIGPDGLTGRGKAGGHLIGLKRPGLADGLDDVRGRLIKPVFPGQPHPPVELNPGLEGGAFKLPKDLPGLKKFFFGLELVPTTGGYLGGLKFQLGLDQIPGLRTEKITGLLMKGLGLIPFSSSQVIVGLGERQVGIGKAAAHLPDQPFHPLQIIQGPVPLPGPPGDPGQPSQANHSSL